jgi:hypothetical protein
VVELGLDFQQMDGEPSESTLTYSASSKGVLPATKA